MTRPLFRIRWITALSVGIFLVIGTAVSVWWLRQDARSGESAEDCAIVEGVAREWADVELVTGSGDTPANWSVLSDKALDAADSVSTPAIRDDLKAWADGFDILAQIQLAESGTPIEGGMSADEFERLRKAGDLIYLTADNLYQACPNLEIS